MKKKKVTSVNVRSFNPTANLIFNIVIAIFAISCVVPFFFVIMISLTSEGSLAANGYRFWPKEFSLEAYRYIFQGAMHYSCLRDNGIHYGDRDDCQCNNDVIICLCHFSFQLSI